MKSDIFETRKYVQQRLGESSDMLLPSIQSVQLHNMTEVIWLNENNEIIYDMCIEDYVDFCLNELRKRESKWQKEKLKKHLNK